MFIPFDDCRVTFALRNCDQLDFSRETFIGRCLISDGLRAERKSILIGAADFRLFGDILACLSHGIDTVLRLHQRIGETPADGRVIDLGMP